MTAAGAICYLRAMAGNVADRGIADPGDLAALRYAVRECREINWQSWRVRVALWLLKHA